MLTLLKHHLLKYHFHAMPHGMASWLDRELQNRLQEIQCGSKCGRGTVAEHFKVKDFLGKAVAIVSNQPAKNAKEKLTTGEEHGKKANCSLIHQNDSTQKIARTKRNDLTSSTGGSSLVLGQHCSTHHSSPAYYFGAKMHLEVEQQLDSFALNAPLSWQAATDNTILALKKRTETDLNIWSAFDEAENEVAVALPLFLNSSSPVCRLENNMMRNVIGVKQQRDSGYRDTFVDNTASNNNVVVVDTPSPEPFRNDSSKIVLQPGGDVTNSMKVQTPSPEPSWIRPAYCYATAGQILHGGNDVILMNVRTPSPENLSSNNEETFCNAQEFLQQKNNYHLFGASHKSPKKLKLTPSPVATDTTRKNCHSHQGVLLIPSPEIDAIAAGGCHTHSLQPELSASQTDDENGIKRVATPSPEHCCNEQERDEYDQASLAQSPHFTGRGTTLNATSPLYSGRHKKRYRSRPSSQSPAFVSLWSREEAVRQVKGQEGGQPPPFLPSNYFYVEQRESSSSPCSLEIESSSHLGKALEFQDDDGGSKSALPPMRRILLAQQPHVESMIIIHSMCIMEIAVHHLLYQWATTLIPERVTIVKGPSWNMHY